MATEVGMDGYAASVGASIDALQADVEDKIDDLNDFLHSATTYSELNTSYLADAVDINFNTIQRATDIISTISYDTVDTRELMPSVSDQEVTHTYNSETLDTIESNLLGILSAAGSDRLKDISSAFLNDSDIASIEAAYGDQLQIVLNLKSDLLSRYETAGTQANYDWLVERSSYLMDDFRKSLYAELFSLAQESAQWAAKQVISIEELHANFTGSYNSLLLGLVSANVTAYKAEVEANIANLKNQITKIDAEVDISTLKADQKIAETELMVRQESERFSAYTSHYGTAMKNTISSLGINISATKSVSAAYKSILSAMSQQYSAVVIGRQ